MATINNKLLYGLYIRGFDWTKTVPQYLRKQVLYFIQKNWGKKDMDTIQKLCHLYAHCLYHCPKVMVAEYDIMPPDPSGGYNLSFTIQFMPYVKNPAWEEADMKIYATGTIAWSQASNPQSFSATNPYPDTFGPSGLL